MGDRTYASVQIGGKVDRLLLPLLLAQFEESCAIPGDDSGMDSWSVAEFDEARELEGFALMGYDQEANYGCIDEVTGFCREWGIDYLHQWESGGGFDAGFCLFLDGKEDESPCIGSWAVPVVYVARLQEIAEANPGITLADALERFKLPDLPPLEIVEGTLTPEQVAKLSA